MIKDPILEWLNTKLREWVYTNPATFDVFLHKIPLSPLQRQILLLRFVTLEHDKLRGFKEIESKLHKSHDCIQKQYIKALKIIQKYIFPYIYSRLPNTM